MDHEDLADTLTWIAWDKEQVSPHSIGGHGALMRTAAVVRAKLGNETELVEIGITTAKLTHADKRSAQQQQLLELMNVRPSVYRQLT